MSKNPLLKAYNNEIQNIIFMHCYLIASDIEEVGLNFVPDLSFRIDNNLVKKHFEILCSDFIKSEN